MSARDRHAVLTLSAAILIALVTTFAVRQLTSRIATPAGSLAAAALDSGLTLLLFGLLGLVAVVAIQREGELAARLGPSSAPLLGAGVGVGFGGLATAYLLATLAGVGAPGSGPFSLGLVLLGTMAVAVQAGAEELYFRGWLLSSLQRAWGAWPALAVSALAFAGLHLLGGARAPLSLVNLLLGGLLFGLLAQRTRGLAAPIAAHAAWNWAEGLLFGLDPNPGTGRFGAIWDHDLVGASLWSGSDEGLNASLATSAVLIALLIPLVVWPGRAGALSRSDSRG